MIAYNQQRPSGAFERAAMPVPYHHQQQQQQVLPAFHPQSHQHQAQIQQQFRHPSAGYNHPFSKPHQQQLQIYMQMQQAEVEAALAAQDEMEAMEKRNMQYQRSTATSAGHRHSASRSQSHSQHTRSTSSSRHFISAQQQQSPHYETGNDQEYSAATTYYGSQHPTRHGQHQQHYGGLSSSVTPSSAAAATGLFTYGVNDSAHAADRWPQHVQQVYQQQHHHQHAPTDMAAMPYMHGYAHASELSVPPVVPAPHQGAGLQPALFHSVGPGAGQNHGQHRGSSRFTNSAAATAGHQQALSEQMFDPYGSFIEDGFQSETALQQQLHQQAQLQQLQHQHQQQQPLFDASNFMWPSSAHDAYGAMSASADAERMAQQQHQQLAFQAQAQSAAEVTLQQQQQQHEHQAKKAATEQELQLIASDASAIPPPPSIEKSAHPLAALATDLVWEAFLSAASNNGSSPSIPSSGSASPTYYQTQFSSRATSQGPPETSDSVAGDLRGNSSPLSDTGTSTAHHAGTYGTSGHSSGLPPRTPGTATQAFHSRNNSKTGSPRQASQDAARARSTSRDENDGQGGAIAAARFGAIGGERKPRQSNLGLACSSNSSSMQASPATRSDSSSPASTAPGTPANDAALNNNGCIVASGSDASLGEKMAKRFAGGAHALYWEEVDSFSHMQHAHHNTAGSKEMHHQSLSQQGVSRANFHQQRFGNLTPPRKLFDQIQKLLGATLLSQQVLLLALYFVAKTPHTSPLYPPATSQSALKSTSAPFKLLLAALVVANKHLDDNSFRNSTFSQVADVTLPEVNALEYSMLAGLNFDINVDTFNWLAWLRDLQSQRTTRFSADYPVNVCMTITPIIDGVLAHQQQHACQFGSPGASFAARAGLDSPQEQEKDMSPRATRSSLAASTNAACKPVFANDIAMVPFSPAPSEASVHSGATQSTFDMDAAGPLAMEQRPQYNKAFGAAPLPSPLSNKQHHYWPLEKASADRMTLVH